MASIARVVPLVLLLVPVHGAAQRPVGSAVASIGDRSYTVIIECDRATPEWGFRTQPNRVTREATGRSNPINIGLRGWKDSVSVVVNVERYVAWIPRPASTGQVLQLTLAMSPNSEVRGGVPTTMTHERWMTGERFDGGRTVSLKATCALAPGVVPGVGSPP